MSFKKPDLVNYSPAPLWFWNDKLNPQELRRQVKLMHEGGVKNFIIHARWGLLTPYLTKEWWKVVTTVIEAARENGGRAWIYDEYNYPSGICGFKITAKEEYRERYLVPITGQTRKGRPWEGELPKGEVVSAFAYPVLNGILDEFHSHRLQVPKNAKSLKWIPPDKQEYKIFIFVKQIEPNEGVGRYSVNYLSPRPFRKFIQLTHEQYAKRYRKDFGNLIPYFFLDEPRFGNALPWDEDIPRLFKRRKGYDLLPKLALLLERGTRETTRVRCDFWDLVSDLYCEFFFKPVGKWCAKHGVELTGHLMAEETLAGNTRFSGHGLKPYKHFQMPGIDYLGKGVGGLTPKMASSIAHHNGNRKVSSETFAGCGWDFTLEEMTAITHWLFSQGVNVMIPHAFFYSIRGNRKNDWPPSMFFQWKHWKRYPEYAKRVARLSEALSGGRHVADVAYFYPIEAFHARYEPDFHYKTGYFRKGPAIADSTALAIEETFQRVGHALQTRHKDFDLVDTETLLSLKVKGKELCDPASGESFKILVLPYVTTMGRKAARLVENFSRNGGTVLALGVLPENSTEREKDPKVLALMKKVFGRKKSIFLPWKKCGPAEIEKAMKALNQLVQTPDISLEGSKSLLGNILEWSDKIHDPYLHQNLDKILKNKKGGVCGYHYFKDGEDLYFLASLVPQELEFTATLRSRASRVELRYSGTGRIEPANVLRVGKETTTVSVILPPLESVIVVFKNFSHHRVHRGHRVKQNKL